MNTNKILSKIVEYGDHLVGNSARRLKGDLSALNRHKTSGPLGVPQSTIDHVNKLSDAAHASMVKTRTNTAIGALLGVGGSYAGAKSYHVHKDNKIMERIDRMYETNYN